MLVARTQDLLKEGSKHLAGIDEAVKSNIDACKDLAKLVRTSLGPNGNDNLLPHIPIPFF
jgi:T-complex protein 1 subunit theta